MFLIVLAGLFSARPVQAQEKRIEVAAFLGGLSVSHDLGSVDNIFFTTTGVADDVSFGKFFGFRAAYNFSRYVGVEGSYSRTENSFLFTVDDKELGIVNLGDQFDVDLQTFSVNAVVQFPTEIGLIPYGTVGFGLQRTDPKGSLGDIDTENGSGANFGGGVKYFFPGVEWVGARFDFRYQLIDEGAAFSGNTAEPRDTELSLGVSFRF